MSSHPSILAFYINMYTIVLWGMNRSISRNWFEFLHIVCVHTFYRYIVFPSFLILFLSFLHNSARLIQSTVVPSVHLGTTWILGIRACLELKLNKHFHQSYLTYACLNTLANSKKQEDTSFDFRKEG